MIYLGFAFTAIASFALGVIAGCKLVHWTAEDGKVVLTEPDGWSAHRPKQVRGYAAPPYDGHV